MSIICVRGVKEDGELARMPGPALQVPFILARVWGFYWVLGLGFGVQGLGFVVLSLGFRMDLEFGVLGTGFWAGRLWL